MKENGQAMGIKYNQKTGYWEAFHSKRYPVTRIPVSLGRVRCKSEAKAKRTESCCFNKRKVSHAPIKESEKEQQGCQELPADRQDPRDANHLFFGEVIMAGFHHERLECTFVQGDDNYLTGKNRIF